MASRLELALLEDDRVDGKLRRTLFDLLHRDNVATTLRMCSRVLHDLVDQRKARVFRDCFFSMPIGRLGINHSMSALKRVAPYCTRLTIKIMFSNENSPCTMGRAVIEDLKRKQLTQLRRRDFERSRPPGGIARAMWDARNQFREDPPASSMVATSAQRQNPRACHRNQIIVEQVLQSLHRATVLDLQINGDPGWPGVTQVEDTIISLRQALEGSRLPSLRTVRFHPVHAAGIIHLRWASFGAFRSQPSLSQQSSLTQSVPQPNSELWTKLTMLDLQIRNPGATGRVSEKQMMMFIQVLDDYLRSFSRTLKCLHFVWIDAPGPSPLLLPDLLERERHIWPHLREFWYGNITSAERGLRLVPMCMPQVSDLRALATSATGCATLCKDGEWQPIDVVDCQRKRSLYLHQPTAQLSQISLVPAPLALSNAATAVQRRPSQSSVYSGHSSPSDQFLTPGRCDITDDNRDMAKGQQSRLHVPLSNMGTHPALRSKQDAGHDQQNVTTALETTECQDVSAPRLPVSSSIYSRDENGDYVPVRHQWHKSHFNMPQQQQPHHLSRGYPALLDAGRRLSASLNNPHRTPQPSVSHDVVSNSLKYASQPLPKQQCSGHRPPALPPARSAVRKNFIDLGDMPAYQAARSQWLQQHPDPASQLSYSANHVSSPKARIKQWAQAVKSGRPPSVMSARSMNTFTTTDSRPLSQFLANLRETGKPARLTRQHRQSKLQ